MKCLPCLFLLITTSLHAEVIFDGTLGPSVNLPGPNYQIESQYGQQYGGNLFHSFREFNLQNHESATFSGPNNVNTIISRVTGGNPSQIDGLLRSTLPNADFYFLNPSGLFFGPNAKLDVQGAFHASTADYLRLGKGGSFHASQPQNSLLTVAPVEAFGFLDNTVAPISLEGRGEISESDWDGKSTGLSSGKTLSLIGGDIDIMKGSYVREQDGSSIRRLGNLNAPRGQINLVSVASKGEVIPTALDLELLGFKDFGDITVSDKSVVDASGNGAGSVLIRADKLTVNDSWIQALRQETQNESQLLSHQPHEDNGVQRIYGINGLKNPVSIDIKVRQLSLKNNSRIRGDSYTSDNAGDISIEADMIDFKNGSWINNKAYARGHAGNILLKANDIVIEEGGVVSLTHGEGNAGRIHIHATGTLILSGTDAQAGWSSQIASLSDPSETDIIGGAGQDILLEAGELILKAGGQISSSSIASEGRQSLPAGNITIRVTGAVKLSGVNPYGENENGFGSGIYVRSKGTNAGKAGTLFLSAGSLSITDGAVISASTSGNAQGGQIAIHVKGPIFISGNSAHIALKEPKASQKEFQSGFLDYQGDRVSISGIYGHSSSPAEQAGAAGTISLSAQQFKLTEGGLINTATENAGGGHISLTTDNLLYLRDSEITTSVQGGTENGGNITIDNPEFVILDNGLIKAQADAGRGGDIDIKSEHFLPSNESIVDATSKVGLDGKIVISSPTCDMSQAVIVLPQKLIESHLKRCDTQDIERPSTFVISPVYRVPPFVK
jgi:filamentous hemagglutinin family protein